MEFLDVVNDQVLSFFNLKSEAYRYKGKGLSLHLVWSTLMLRCDGLSYYQTFEMFSFSACTYRSIFTSKVSHTET